MNLTITQARDKANGLYRQGKYSESAHLYNQILRIVPDNADLLNDAGVVYTAFGGTINITEAKKCYQKAIDLYLQNSSGGDLAVAYCNFGHVLQKEKNYIEAISYYQKAVDKDDKYVPAYINLSGSYNCIGEHEKAITTAQIAVKLDPESFQAYHNLGVGYSNLAESDKAISYYKKALSLNDSPQSLTSITQNDLESEMGRRDILQLIKKNSVCLEIGTYRGFYAEKMDEYSSELHLVDPWKIDSEVKWNVNIIPQELMDKYYKQVIDKFQNNPKVTIHKVTSQQAVSLFPDKYFDFIYLDAGREYTSVKADLKSWYPKVKAGGYLVGRDYNPILQKQKVIKAVDEFISENNLTEQFEIRGNHYIISI